MISAIEDNVLVFDHEPTRAVSTVQLLRFRTMIPMYSRALLRGNGT